MRPMLAHQTSGGSRIFCLGGLMGGGFFFWGGLWGFRGGYAGRRVNCDFRRQEVSAEKKFLIYAFPQKISSISKKFLMTFFFFFFFFFSSLFFFFFFFFFFFYN